MGEIQSDTRVRVAGGGQLPGQVRLPQLDDVQPYEDPLLDRIGRMVGEQPFLVAGSMVAGSVLGARSGGGLVSSTLRGAAGLAAGFVGAVAIGTLASRWFGTGSSSTGRLVDGSPTTLEQHPATDGSEHLRVMSWNVRELIGADGEVRTDDQAVADVRAEVEREHPDVLMLQEVRDDAWISRGHDNLAELATALGATSAVLVGNGTRPNGTQKGQAILTFGDTTVQDARGLHHMDPTGHGLVHDLQGAAGWAHASGWPVPSLGGEPFHPRTTADAMITTPDGTAVRVLDVHLSGTGGPVTGGTPGSTKSQQDQLVPVADTIPAWDGPTLLAGDFNVQGGTSFATFEAAVLGEVGMHDAFTQLGITPGARKTWSFPAWGPAHNIDRLYTSEDVHVNTARIADGGTVPSASDHRPLVADLEIEA